MAIAMGSSSIIGRVSGSVRSGRPALAWAELDWVLPIAARSKMSCLRLERTRLLIQNDSWNRERVTKLVGPAREAGIKVRDIARMTGLSTQTLHTWMVDLMRPIPDIHLSLDRSSTDDT